ncbi:hypothetical protein KBD49_15240, partial [Myxococcota bacterium]|nr:hypothetical protein [Myxococcota bacterium]
GDACTRTDACREGSCIGTDPVTCTALDACHVAGLCDPATGVCPDPVAPDGTGCDDGDACTRTDACREGICIGTDPVNCTALDACHVAGLCDPATGGCPDPLAADGKMCDDGDACTRSDTCREGICTGTDPVICLPLSPCHAAGTCDPATGACTSPFVAEGTECDDGDPCTREDSCDGRGLCTGSPIPACDPDPLPETPDPVPDTGTVEPPDAGMEDLPDLAADPWAGDPGTADAGPRETGRGEEASPDAPESFPDGQAGHDAGLLAGRSGGGCAAGARDPGIPALLGLVAGLLLAGVRRVRRAARERSARCS